MKFYIDTELNKMRVYYIIRDQNRVCYGYYINKEDCMVALKNLLGAFNTY